MSAALTMRPVRVVRPAVDYPLPENPAVEDALLGGLLIRPQALSSVRAALGLNSSSAFSRPNRAALFKAFCEIADAGRSFCDPAILEAHIAATDSPDLPKRGEIMPWLASFLAVNPAGSRIDEYAETLRRTAADRLAIASARAAANVQQSADGTLSDAERAELFRRLDEARAHLAAVDDAPKRRYVPFPIGTFPEPLRSYVQRAAASIGCDAALVGLPMLATVAGAIGNRAKMIAKHGYFECANIWTAAICDSGSGKSPAMKYATRPLEAVEDRLSAEHAAALDAPPADGEDAPGEDSLPPRLIVDDATIEAIGAVHEKNPFGLLKANDELAALFKSFGEYKPNGGSDEQRWLSIHSGGALRIDRKNPNAPRLFIPAAAVSVCGSIQPAVFADHVLKKDRVASGLAARFLVAMPPDAPRRWTDADLPDEAAEGIESLLYNIVTMLQRRESDSDDGNPDPYYVKLSRDALGVYEAFFNRMADDRPDRQAATKAACSKIQSAALRIALAFHVVECEGRGLLLQVADERVSGETMRRATDLAEWFDSEYTRVIETMRPKSAAMPATARDDNPDRLGQLAAWARGRGAVSPRDIQRSGPTFFRRMPAAEVESALRELERAGLATPGVGSRGSLTFTVA